MRALFANSKTKHAELLIFQILK